jgi:hypothetical protein
VAALAKQRQRRSAMRNTPAPPAFAVEAASILDWLRRVLASAGGGAAHCRVLVGE